MQSAYGLLLFIAFIAFTMFDLMKRLASWGSFLSRETPPDSPKKAVLIGSSLSLAAMVGLAVAVIAFIWSMEFYDPSDSYYAGCEPEEIPSVRISSSDVPSGV
jgi:Na+/proline symporter